MFRVRAVDGSTRSVTAGRVVVADAELRFQSPASTGWVTVDSAPLTEVARVSRRCNGPDGRVRWVDESEADDAAAATRCETRGGDDTVERPTALVERSRGTQLSAVGYTDVGLCRVCDADDLAAALAHGGPILPKELPTVDPQTLREMSKRAAVKPKPSP